MIRRPETSQPPALPEPPQFEHRASARNYFDAILPIAHWNEAVTDRQGYNGNYAWFKPVQGSKIGPGMVVQAVVEVSLDARGQTFTPTPEAAAPKWLGDESHTPITFRYRKWTLGTGEDPQEHERTVWPGDLKRPLIPREETHPSRQESSYRPAVTPVLCYVFGKRAKTLENLAHYTEAYVRWLDESRDLSGREATTLPDMILAKSLSLAKKEGSFGTAGTNPVVAALGAIRPEHPAYPLLSSAFTASASKLLLGQALPSDTTIHSKVSEAAILEAIQALDEQLFLTSNFWITAGMTDGTAMRNTGFLQLLYDKVVNRSGPELIISEDGIDADRAVRSYMTNLLVGYAHDPRCDITEVHRILKYTLTDGLINRTSLTHLANQLGRLWNKDKDPSNHYRLLDPNKPRDSVNALLRILSVIHFSTIPEDVKRQLAQEHRFHAQILAAVADLDTPPTRQRRVPSPRSHDAAITQE